MTGAHAADLIDFDELERLYGIALAEWQRHYLSNLLDRDERFTRTVIVGGRRAGIRTVQRIAADMLREKADNPPRHHPQREEHVTTTRTAAVVVQHPYRGDIRIPIPFRGRSQRDAFAAGVQAYLQATEPIAEKPGAAPFEARIAPTGIPVTRDTLRGVWDTFVAPSQSDDAPPQSVETRALMAILRGAYAALPPTAAEPATL